jgi:hypothetical protein
VVLAVCALAPASRAVAEGGDDAAAVSAYADVLVDAATSDLEFPMHAVPDAFVGVLGTKVEGVRRLVAFVAARRQAAIAAWAEAYRIARSRPTVVGGGVRGGGARRGGSCNGDFACFKACTLQIESHGNYAAVSPGGTYRGAWQFDQSTWNGAVARAGYPQWSGRDPPTAPPAVQAAAAPQLYHERGNQPWGGRC